MKCATDRGDTRPLLRHSHAVYPRGESFRLYDKQRAGLVARNKSIKKQKM